MIDIWLFIDTCQNPPPKPTKKSKLTLASLFWLNFFVFHVLAMWKPHQKNISQQLPSLFPKNLCYLVSQNLKNCPLKYWFLWSSSKIGMNFWGFCGNFGISNHNWVLSWKTFTDHKFVLSELLFQALLTPINSDF